jgi:hypothetical protein
VSAASLDVAPVAFPDPEADAGLAEFFESCPTSFAQQTPGWRDVILGAGADEPCFLACRRGGELVGVLPAYRFDGPKGAILTSASQAGRLGGVACRDTVDPESVYAALIGGFVELARSRHCALATILTNPIWSDRERCERLFEPDYVLENTCQVLDLASVLDGDGEFTATSSHLRRNLRRALSGPLYVDEAQSRENVETWYEIHRDRHTEISARPLPYSLFTGALEHAVPRGKARFFFVRHADSHEMVAGGLYVCHGSVIDALMPSLRSEFAKLSPNYLLAAHSMRWAAQHGFRHYNWQGSPPGSGVDRFKRQWGSRDHSYAYLTRVTGDAEPFLRSSPAELDESYAWHYVLPYDRLGAGGDADVGPSTRSAAWRARDEAGP